MISYTVITVNLIYDAVLRVRRNSIYWNIKIRHTGEAAIIPSYTSFFFSISILFTKSCDPWHRKGERFVYLHARARARGRVRKISDLQPCVPNQRGHRHPRPRPVSLSLSHALPPPVNTLSREFGIYRDSARCVGGAGSFSVRFAAAHAAHGKSETDSVYRVSRAGVTWNSSIFLHAPRKNAWFLYARLIHFPSVGNIAINVSLLMYASCNLLRSAINVCFKKYIATLSVHRWLQFGNVIIWGNRLRKTVACMYVAHCEIIRIVKTSHRFAFLSARHPIVQAEAFIFATNSQRRNRW